MTLSFAESEEVLQRVVHEFYSVCMRRKLKVNAGKSKVMVFEWREVGLVDFNTPYKINVTAGGRCEVVLGEELEEMSFSIWEQYSANMESWKKE